MGFACLSCFGKPFLQGLSPRRGAKARIRAAHPCFCMLIEKLDFFTSWAGRMAPRSEAPQGQKPSRLMARPVRSLAAKPRQRQDIKIASSARFERADEHKQWERRSSVERLVPVSFMHCCTSTPGLSTWSSSTALIGNTRFQVGFPLRCLQRLSRPYIATLLCRWHDNRSTRDMSIPVLSY